MFMIALSFVESHVLCRVFPFSSSGFRARGNPSFKAGRDVISVMKKPIEVVAGRVLTVTNLPGQLTKFN